MPKPATKPRARQKKVVRARPATSKTTPRKPPRPPRSLRLLSRGLDTTDHYIALCQALISDLSGGRVTKREALQSIREANKWLLAWSRKSGL